MNFKENIDNNTGSKSKVIANNSAYHLAAVQFIVKIKRILVSEISTDLYPFSATLVSFIINTEAILSLYLSSVTSL
jgi:hypothetical protein